MVRNLLLLSLFMCSIGALHSQCSDPEACNYDPNSSTESNGSACLILDTHEVHTTGALAGLTTYRLYVHLTEPDHFLSAISTIIDENADPEENPGQTTSIRIATTTSFYQDQFGSATSTGISSNLLSFFPDLLYDSWVTIGHAPENGAPAATVSTIASPTQNWVANFESGEDLIMDDIIGGLWYIYNDGNGQGLPDENGDVLIAQLTTSGTIEVELSGQFFPNHGSGPNGEADGTADIQFITELGPDCPNDINANCTYPASEEDCDGNCLVDEDSDGICDENDPCVGTLDGCNVCNGPGPIEECGCSGIPQGDCDCNGNQLDALGVCGGPCSSDSDLDGICDDVDPCVGSLDACGVCNGPGAIYDCGCEAIPPGDCDCNGNQADAIGICGGNCTSDSDEDGICDNQDPCVGSFDALGECNGNCTADSDNDDICDDVDPCVGAYDALGVCNGNCPSDIDDDGVCDNAEIPGCTDNEACNFDSDATDDDGSCEVEDAVGDCGGDCENDIDNDNVCDDVDPCVGDLDACGVCNGPGSIYDCGCSGIPAGDCDCEGNQVDVVGDCGGSCTEDTDQDGICDDVDACIGQYDACGVCNGVGDIFQCGCNNIPEGECDCNGNQLDVVGVCGGSCTEDTDQDGICDDIDPCVGSLDACGICNGPGAILDCGCSSLPAGDCDCDGNQLDALGNCGGPCSADLDQDGICDDIDPCVGSLDACGICNGPGAILDCGCSSLPAGDCDCDGNQLDALGNCGGPCSADLDQDGICDDIDPCVGSLDACGICNGPGAILDCGCSSLPAGDCDCDGNQLDALGNCGGPCSADLDQDGICDDIDPCVGSLDACGICNGPGAILDCGCSSLPVGDCDCDGNQLDALGNCGGPCSADLDQDGICDDIDPCVGSLDACGICNGPGAILDCGCSSLPVGDCDCDGNQLDALGECDGECESDLNSNGICDTDEPSGCTYEEAINYDSSSVFDNGTCTFSEPCDENDCPIRRQQ